jgi:hypothetical protein
MTTRSGKSYKPNSTNDITLSVCTSVCFEFETGGKRWRNAKGLTHRDNDEPAVIRANGTRFWYQNGIIERHGGKPAVITSSGLRKWYKNGRLVAYSINKGHAVL